MPVVQPKLFRMRRERKMEEFAPAHLAVGILACSLGILPAGLMAGSTGQEDVNRQLQTAAGFHEHRDFAHSIPILKEIVRRYPQNYRANLLLGEDLLSNGKPRDALVPLRAASEAQRDDIVALDYLLMAAAAVDDAATEAEAHETVVARSGGDERHLLAWGIFCLNRFGSLRTELLNSTQGQGAELRLAAWGSPGGTEAAASILEKSAADDPDQAGIWGELGIGQFEAGKPAQANASLKEAEARQPLEASTFRLEALLAAADNDWHQAAARLLALASRSPAELANAIRLWPPNMVPPPSMEGELWNCIRNPANSCPLTSLPPAGGEGLSARDLFKEGRWEQLKALPVAAAADSSEWFWHGMAEFHTGDFSLAIPALERGLQENRLHAAFYLQACYAREETGVEARLNRDENHGALHELRGERALSLQNDPAAALKEFLEAATSRPQDASLLSRLASTYRLLGDMEHARASALSALSLDPGQTPALETLAQLDMNERNYGDALIQLKRLSALLPEDQRIRVDLGITYGQLGHPADAVRYLEPPLKAGFPDPRGTLHALLATALRKVGRLEDAKRAAIEAARLSNGGSDADSK